MIPDPIRITYLPNSDQPPKVTIPLELRDLVRVELIDGEEAELRFLEHGGVTIYQTYTHHGTTSGYWYAVEYPLSSKDNRAFDVRDLPEIPAEHLDRYAKLYDDEDKQVFAYAIDQKLITQEEGYSHE